MSRNQEILRGYSTMNRNILYIAIGVLAVATLVFGYQLYQERQKTTGIEITVDKDGISIEKTK
jgi:predicted negative regulator of RcsB-dependent stress response